MRETTPQRLAWLTTTVLSTLVGAYAIVLVASAFRLLPPEIAANRFPTPWVLWTHIAAGSVAILTGPWQFLSRLRTSRPRWHQLLGRIYVAACLTAGLAGGLVATTTTSGPVAATGFVALASAWVATTALGLRAALQHRFAEHREWMIRSFALTFAAVTLRLYLSVALGSGVSFHDAYPAIAWLCWVPNLVLAQALIWSQRAKVANAIPQPTS